MDREKIPGRVLITGAKGMLGQDVTAAFTRQGTAVLPLGRADLDIGEPAAVKRVVTANRPGLIINCAAYTKVDQAESNPEEALRVNALGVRYLALICREENVPLVHISTDYVFPGQKEGAWGIYDPRQPGNVYGRSKYLGERFLETIAPRYYLVRTAWLFGAGGPNFVRTILELAREKETLSVVDDQWGCPTYTKDLAAALVDLVATGACGIYHITNRGTTTWYRFARAILTKTGNKIPLRPLTTAEYPRPARRPANAILDPFPLQETIGYLLPPWEDALTRYLIEAGEICN